MISLDQVLLLEKKVESAVAKIQQLQAENDALRSKCAELTNALSSKSEQLTTFETDQNQIESGILKALDQLNSIENSVLKATGQGLSSTPSTSSALQNKIPNKSENLNPLDALKNSPVVSQVNSNFSGSPVQSQNSFNQKSVNPFDSIDFNKMGQAPSPVQNEVINNIVPEKNQELNNQNNIPEQENPDNLGFDIF